MSTYLLSIAEMPLAPNRLLGSLYVNRIPRVPDFDTELHWLNYRTDIQTALQLNNATSPDHLPDSIKSSVSSAIDRLVDLDISPQPLLENRLGSIKVQQLSHLNKFNPLELGVFVMHTGIASIFSIEDEHKKSYVITHEIIHGLSTPGSLAMSDGRVFSTGIGLHREVTNSGNKLDQDTILRLDVINEAVVEYINRAAWQESEPDFVNKEYQLDKLYFDLANRLASMSDRARNSIMKACFLEGIRSKRHARDFINQFANAAEGPEDFERLTKSYLRV